jgi:hypothetical protein
MKLWQALLLGASGMLTLGAASSSTGARRKYPQGKGLFIDDLVREGKNPQHLIERLKWLDVSWLAIEVHWVDKNQNNTHNLEDGALAAFVPELTKAGIECWVWVFPAPWAIEQTVELVRHAYKVAPQVRGVILDVEAPFQGASEVAASELTSRMVDLGKPVGLCSYPIPAWHPAVPWEGFSEAHFGMPMIYGERGETFPNRSDDAWRKLGFEVVIPVNGASSAHRTNDPDGFGIEDQANVSDTSDGAIAWWSYRHLVLADDSRRSQRAKFVRNWSGWGGDGDA